MNATGPRRRRVPHDRRILVLSLAGGAPALLVAAVAVWSSSVSTRFSVAIAVVVCLCWLGCAFAVRRAVVFPLQTLANLLACLREGDTSFRASGARPGDALGEVMLEANALVGTVRDQRLDAREATALLGRVMAEIDVAVFAFDRERRVRLVNRAGERVLDRTAEALLNVTADELGLGACLDDDQSSQVPIVLPGSAGRWEVRRSGFRLGGLPHCLLILTDVSRSLRDEERQAWQRLMRVLGHEINNSLAPIKSIAASLAAVLSRSPDTSEAREDMQHGLEVIASRAEALARFTAAYSRLAHLPVPRRREVSFAPIVRRVVSLEPRLPVALEEGPDLTVFVDPDLIEQALINLVKNAVDASLETAGAVRVGWTVAGRHLQAEVIDEGPGLGHTANLFVPFFTTKPGGSGIGLVLSRQIAEAHGGSLTVENREDGPGCVARLRLPASPR
jgi:nitrogen fixation/metabolism regulation signal transduction histidine kinase